MGDPLSIWVCTMTTTASKTALCLSNLWRNVLDKASKCFNRRLKVSCRSRALDLKLCRSESSMRSGLERQFFSAWAVKLNPPSTMQSFLIFMSFSNSPLSFIMVLSLVPPLKGPEMKTHCGLNTESAIRYLAAQLLNL